MFGLDICNTAVLKKAEFDQIVAVHTPITDLYREDLGNRYPGFLKNPRASGFMWDSLAAAYLLDPGFVTRSETKYLDVVTIWGRFYGATVPLDPHFIPDATPVKVMLELDFKRVFSLYKDRLVQQD
jgi:inosine-uridine nucleoside N-ribohydrolase